MFDAFDTIEMECFCVYRRAKRCRSVLLIACQLIHYRRHNRQWRWFLSMGWPDNRRGCGWLRRIVVELTRSVSTYKWQGKYSRLSRCDGAREFCDGRQRRAYISCAGGMWKMDMCTITTERHRIAAVGSAASLERIGMVRQFARSLSG